MARKGQSWFESPARRWLAWGTIVVTCLCVLNPARGQPAPYLLPEFVATEATAGLTRREPTALAAGDEDVLVQPLRPEASAYGSRTEPTALAAGDEDVLVQPLRPEASAYGSRTEPTALAAGNDVESADLADLLVSGPQTWTTPQRLGGTLQLMLLMTVVSLAPAILLMTTSFVRILVVLGLLRQALGTQQLPPSQVITSLALFMSLLIMTPVWKQVYDDAIRPYTDPTVDMSIEQAWDAGVRPVRRFMSQQIEVAGNSDDVWLFYDYLGESAPATPPSTYDDVPLQVLLPAFMLSELKTAFLIGFQIYLPFLILDLVIASVTISMGMLMLPPVMISLPFKILLFVLVDGWHLVVGMLLESFAPFT